MENQYANNNGNNNGNIMQCDCGCGLYFCGAEGMGFQIKIGEVLIMERRIYERKWSDYLHLENVHTWADFKEMLIQAFDVDKNSKVWTHLYPYSQINGYEHNILPYSRVEIDLIY